MTDEMTTKPDRSDKTGLRWSRIVLVASLALNLAVLGVVGGAILRWDAGMDRARALQVRDFGFGPFIGAFDTKERRALGREFRRSTGDPKVARQEIETMFQDMLEALRAEPFEAVRFEALLLKQQRDFSERQKIGAELVVDQIATMPSEARMAYAERLEQMIKNPPRPPRIEDEGGKLPVRSKD